MLTLRTFSCGVEATAAAAAVGLLGFVHRDGTLSAAAIDLDRDRGEPTDDDAPVMLLSPLSAICTVCLALVVCLGGEIVACLGGEIVACLVGEMVACLAGEIVEDCLEGDKAGD